jgi:uroporphyrinogen-III synthase
VLVTRPVDQAERLCRLLTEAGHECVRLPLIEIRPAVDPAPLAVLADTLDDYDLAVFISVNAVQAGLDAVLARRSWPAHTRIAAVGARTAEAVRAHGLEVDLLPAHSFNSEALLALDELADMQGQRVVILRGNGGRDLLRDTLRARGAQVDYVEVYRRVCPDVDDATLERLLQPGYLDCITITSNEALQNLESLAGPGRRAALHRIPLVVIGARQAHLARELGYAPAARVAAHAGDEYIVAALGQ